MKYTQEQVEELTTQIISGKKIFFHDNEAYAVCFPSMEDRDSSKIIYMKKVKEFLNKGVPSLEDVRINIKKQQLIPDSLFRRREYIISKIEEYEDIKRITNSDFQIAEIVRAQGKLSDEKYAIDIEEALLLSGSAEKMAEDAKILYLLSKCVLIGEELGVILWKGYSDFLSCNDREFVLTAKENFLTLMRGLSSGEVMAVARSNEWRKRWMSAKQTGSSVFRQSSSEWDCNKVNLCFWSDFYDSVFDYKTPPPKEIIEDDDKLFKWIRDINRLNGKKDHQEGAARKKVGMSYKIRQKENG